MLKQFWKDYLTFSKKERTALLILFFVVLIIVLLPSVFPAKEMSISIDTQLQRQLDSITQQESFSNGNSNADASTADSSIQLVASPTLFAFDPNTLDEEGFLKLGLNAKLVHTIINYRNKGGYFKTPQDIKKIYSLSNADAEKLIPYIQIPSEKNIYSATETKKQVEEKVVTPNKTYQTININTAAADDWKNLPGIGDVLSNRIIKFRNSIGGFKSVDDVKRTYGLSDSTFNLIRPYLILK